jgi:hypothetical protein
VLHEVHLVTLRVVFLHAFSARVGSWEGPLL